MEVEVAPLIQKKKKKDKLKKEQRSPQTFWVVMILFSIFAVFMSWIVYDDEGKPDIPLDRKQELDDYAEKLEIAEQYMLYATEDGNYVCVSCGEEKRIFLKKGEVWKYGVTTNGEKGRYPAGLPDNRLNYIVQFRGNLTICLVEEKRKIIYYPILPENVARDKKLNRPPGNSQDR